MKIKGKYFFTAMILLLLFYNAEAQDCTLTLGIDQNYIVGSAFNIQPGDVVCFEPGTKNFIQLKDIHGTSDKPITFINKGGVVVINTDHYFGIKIGNCSHIIFRGDGNSKYEYGFQIKKVTGGAGVSVDDKSTDVELSHLEISNTAIGGLYAKTDPTCDNYQEVDRDHFTMYNFSFHDSYIHDVADEGMYIGNSHYTGYTLQGCNTFVYPHSLKGVKVYNNIVENTGWDGIQVSAADSNCQIYNNRIHFDSQSEAQGQMSGILIGGGSKCKVYNNQITDGKGDGIEVFGLGNMEIFNNLIVNAGLNYQPDDPSKLKHGIYVGTVTTEQAAILGIYNNSIIHPKSFGITLTNTQIFKNRIINNLITEPGKFDENGDRAFINYNISETRFEISNNFKTNDNQAVHFVASNSGNYDLKGDSPAVNFGTDLSAEGVTFDILNRNRPFHGYFDAGAFESHDPEAGVATKKASDVKTFKVFPNPAHTAFRIHLEVRQSQPIVIILQNINGQQLFKKTTHVIAGQRLTFPVEISNLASGAYLLQILSTRGTSNKIVFKK